VRLPNAKVDRVFHGGGKVKNLANAGCIDVVHPLRNPLVTHCFEVLYIQVRLGLLRTVL
jgi:hypothetical protein